MPYTLQELLLNRVKAAKTSLTRGSMTVQWRNEGIYTKRWDNIPHMTLNNFLSIITSKYHNCLWLCWRARQLKWWRLHTYDEWSIQCLGCPSTLNHHQWELHTNPVLWWSFVASSINNPEWQIDYWRQKRTEHIESKIEFVENYYIPLIGESNGWSWRPCWPVLDWTKWTRVNSR